ncbi:glutamate 5-kinase [Halovulum sp. GXIMD14793]
MDALSQDILGQAKRVVIKIGSALLVDSDKGALRTGWLQGLAVDVAALKGQGVDVVLVSSGSIALGRRKLGLPSGPLALDQSQAAAAVGQILLAQSYQETLGVHNLTAAQVLLTLEDSEHRRRYLNMRATFAALLWQGAVPVVNENDTVATDEIRYGDNDRLAAQVASLTGAEVLVLLSDVDGLYDANPREVANAQHLPMIAEITPEVEAMAGGAGTDGAKGGMKTKLMAARIAMQAGAAMAITRGDVDRPLQALADGARCTWFKGQGDPKAARKQWISAMKPRGTVTIDAGAARALSSGKSLLPAGVSAISGTFERGDPVDILGPDGGVLARALAGYDAAEARLIMGCQSSAIAERLGHPGRAALIHRDDMAM